MTSLDVLVVDDEEFARLRLRTLIEQQTTPEARVVGEAGSVAQAMQWLDAHRCDVILLDIQMPGADGLELASMLQLRSSQRQEVPAVVFVTAHAQHALRAFELEALDYLTKPVRRERLAAALARVAQRRPGGSGTTTEASVSTTGPAPSAPIIGSGTDPVLVVSERGRVVRVPLRDVLYLKAELKYVTLRTATHSYVLDDALNDLEQRLGDTFLRVHRNALVARQALRLLERRTLPGERDEEASEGWAIHVEPVGEWLAVSRRQVPAVRDAIAARRV